MSDSKLEGGTSFQNHKKSLFAPYQVWFAMRILGITLYITLFLWFVHAFYIVVVLGYNNREANLYLWWLFINAMVIGRDFKHYKRDVPLLCELIGTMLVSKACSNCWQSVFNYAPPHGQNASLSKNSYWPSRHCAGCGCDMTKRASR
jgi:hypothetical protein